MKTLSPPLYDELRRLARLVMSRERASHTLQPTALAHEAYMRLGFDSEEEREKWLAYAARTMRRVLVDHARRRDTEKRGGKAQRVTLIDLPKEQGRPTVDLLVLDEALRDLERLDARKAQVVDLLFFAGLTLRETAKALALSPTTVEDDWYMARAWLRARIQ